MADPDSAPLNKQADERTDWTPRTIVPKPLRSVVIEALPMLLHWGNGLPLLRGVPKSDKPERPCIVCGKMKRHNNSFCSRECCRAFKNNPGGSGDE